MTEEKQLVPVSDLPEISEIQMPHVTEDQGEFEILLDKNKFEQLQRVAKLFSCSTIVPKHFQNNIADCFIISHMAMRLQCDPFMMIQNTYVVNGKPGIEGKLAIALVNARGPYKGGIQFEWKGNGDNRACTAFGIRRETGKRDEMLVSVKTAKDEGWWDKNPKWRNMTDLMLAYRSAAWLARLHCPQVLMGILMKEEVEDLPKENVNTGAAKQLQNLLDETPFAEENLPGFEQTETPVTAAKTKDFDRIKARAAAMKQEELVGS